MCHLYQTVMRMRPPPSHIIPSSLQVFDFLMSIGIKMANTSGENLILGGNLGNHWIIWKQNR
jgi:hypothetical protein